MSYQHVHVQHVEHHPPPGYPDEYPPPSDFPPPPPRPGFPNPSAPLDYPPPPPRPGYGPSPPPLPGYGPSPPPHEHGYQGYFYDGYQPPLSAAPPPLRPYRQYDDGCDSLIRSCLAALCCCCLLERCCF